MKLRQDVNVPALLEAVQNCDRDVNFVTPEGDNLNLKSTLSQFIFASVVAGKLRALEGSVVVQNSEDAERLRKYCE
ncbi:MAG: polya polymerase [bacterium]|nr:polya polymerase [bacterium]